MVLPQTSLGHFHQNTHHRIIEVHPRDPDNPFEQRMIDDPFRARLKHGVGGEMDDVSVVYNFSGRSGGGELTGLLGFITRGWC